MRSFEFHFSLARESLLSVYKVIIAQLSQGFCTRINRTQCQSLYMYVMLNRVFRLQNRRDKTFILLMEIKKDNRKHSRL